MIDEVKGAVTIVENLLARCGNSDTEMALSERFLMAMSARLGDPAMTELHCDLVAKMNALNDLLNTNFRIEPVALRALAESV